ncbi:MULTISPECIES: hypothetical protein [unclassified Chitinophaga]|uniref:hypothetical protein n=1 Tax=unclassified Chitinophaga TaxID=2619133 RepID=UPI0009C4F838|nr:MULTISPECIES: hypothetical protein [unclassified Chitinophaga]OMP76823.1 hypothetical protein BW716_23125 [[Flexibacter] sp. ATCC 35208]WPV65203.1 hypothetical protein QQL36_25695 [Chitinophaga sp. LS1]
MKITMVDSQTELLSTGTHQWALSITSGNDSWIVARYRTPYPALKAYPLELILQPSEDQRIRSVTYRLIV